MEKIFFLDKNKTISTIKKETMLLKPNHSKPLYKIRLNYQIFIYLIIKRKNFLILIISFSSFLVIKK
jgi:hypothetical protein